MKKTTFLLLLLTSVMSFAQPTTDAPVPTKDVANVISIFSDAYTDYASNYNPSWGQTGSVNTTYDPTSGGTNYVLAYTNFNFQGTDLTTQDAAAMEYLHLDVWTSAIPANTTLQVSPVNGGTGHTGPTETLVTISYTSGSWHSVDIPKSSFTDMTWNAVNQLKFAANGVGSTVPVDIYLDNIYFWKTPVDPATDATLSDLQVDGTTIVGFSPAITEYSYELAPGTSTVPTVTATKSQTNATQQITQAPQIPGDATVVVTASNNTDTKTYTVSFAILGPSTAAPTPPARAATNVISIFSDAYTDITVDSFDKDWCPATTTDVSIAGNATKKITGLGCEGIEFITDRFDATVFTNFHMDIFTDTPTLDKSFNIKFSNWGGGTGEVNAIEYSGTNVNFLTNPNPGTWISIDLALSDFSAGDRSDLVQFVITSDLDKVYYDNLYLYKAPIDGIDVNDEENINIYPNPANLEWNVSSENESITSIEIFDIQGRLINSYKPNSSLAKVDAIRFAKGIYFTKISTTSGSSVQKLIKK